MSFPDSPFARVRARVASIWADGPDEGTNPDWRPAAGEKITLTPSIGSQLLTYDVGGSEPIIVTVERVQCVVDEDGWLTKGDDGRPVFIAPTDDPLLSATGWTWTANIKGKSVVFAAPTGGVVDLAVFIAAPATDDTKLWVERIPELITAGTSAVDAAALAVEARDTATGAASTATEQAGLATTARTGAEDARDDAAAYAAGMNVQVGGRNLLPTRRELYNTSQTYGFWRLKADDDPSELLLTVYDNDPTVELPSASGTYFGFTAAGGSNDGGTAWAVSAGKLVYRTRVSDYPFFSIYPRTLETFVAVFSRYRIKIERGNTATDWTPAPEDIGVNPDTAQWAAPHSLALELADTTAALSASTIVGVGRPDIPATLTTPGTAALVAAAQPGAEFRSTDGPQGAWVWRKRGTSWVCVEGDTGWVELPVPETTGVITHPPQAVMIRRTTYAVNLLIDRLSFTEDYLYGELEIAIPTGFQVERSVYLPYIAYAAAKRLFLSNAGFLRITTAGAAADFRTQQFWTPRATWPTTLTI